jgi:4-cresol dehydrogenase (hydroxylating)
MPPLTQALQAWRTLLGDEYLITNSSERCQAERTTFATTQQIPAILRPGTRSEVQACIEIAYHNHIPIYPISTGKNWGYGSRVPVTDGNVLLDLGRLSRIVAFDETLATITVEPGVTFGQVQSFLREQGSRLMLTPTGSSLHTSLIGNALERGLAGGLYADRWQHVCALEVILPDGEILHTGFARFANAHAATVHRWGSGPDLDGLFAQSNFGVVTEMTCWLTPVPGFLQSMVFTAEDDSTLASLIDRLQQLKLAGLLNAPVQIYNTIRLMASFMQHPSPEVPLTPALLPALRTALGLSAWTGWMDLPAPNPTIGNAIAATLYAELTPVTAQLLFFNFHGGEPEFDPDAPLGRLAQQMMASQRMRIAEDNPIYASYWRKTTPPRAPFDPDRDGCGVLWYAPVVPFRGHHVTSVVNLIEATAAAYALEPHIALKGISERAMMITCALMFDRDRPGDDERALACYEELHRRGAEAGYYPYRYSIHSMAGADTNTKVLSRLKQVLDPHHILAPGRYLSPQGVETTHHR